MALKGIAAAGTSYILPAVTADPQGRDSVLVHALQLRPPTRNGVLVGAAALFAMDGRPTRLESRSRQSVASC